MGVVIKITQDDLPKLKKKLENLKKTKELFQKIGAYMSSSTQRKINESKFKPNHPHTKFLKKSDKPLRDKGLLLASIASESDDTSAIVGTNRPFAEVHQKGMTIKAKNAERLAIPASHEMAKLVLKKGSVRKALEFLKSGPGGFYTIVWPKKKKSILGITVDSRGQKKVELLFFRSEAVEIPQRKFLYNDDIDERVIEEMMINHAKKA